MDRDEIKALRQTLPHRTTVPYSEWTKEEKQLDKELSCREMIDSCLIYNESFFDSHYKDDYIKELGINRVNDLYNEQLSNFNNSQVIINAYTDSEGVSYNSLVKKEDLDEHNDRKYFDYELALNGYLKFKYMSEHLTPLQLSYLYNTSADINDLANYETIDFHLEDYNIIAFLNNSNNNWKAEEFVEIYSYSGNEDSIYITNSNQIENRLKNLDDWANKHEYSENDYNQEKESLLQVLGKINTLNKNNEEEIEM